MCNLQFVQLTTVALATMFAVCVSATSLTAGDLRGRVLDAVSGRPAADVLVSIEATKQSLSGREGEDKVRETRTDANGDYQFSALPPLTYNVWADAADRTCSALNSIPVVTGEVRVADDLQLVEGIWIEGRIQTLGGEPLSRDPKSGERLRIGLSGPTRPRTGATFESTTVDDDGRFRLRACAGRNFPYLLSREVWERTWRKEKYEQGIDVKAGQAHTVSFRVLDQQPKRLPKLPRPARDPVKLAPPVAEEWDCAETIRDLGGWYRLDEDRHVVEISMVYNDETGKRFDNSYTDSDEALRIAPAFSRLKRLYLHKAQATDESLACLADLEGLETFYIWDAIAVTNSGARHLVNLENLTNIHLSNSPVGDAALEALSKLPKLNRISMQGNSFTDAGLAHLARMKKLQSLWIGLSKGKITEAGIAHLAGLENLTELELQNNEVTDAGLVHLTELKNLTRLFLGKSSVTEDGLAALRKALPNLNVIR